MEESDSNTLATAWRELREETTLTGTSLTLFRRGKPYSFVDESVGREWTINPFAFVLRSVQDGGQGEAGIQLDWEHEGYEWFDPNQVNESDSFEGVPRLLESLRRVWFNIDLGEDAGRALGEGLAALQRDHESGARQLASKALDVFVDVIQRLDTTSRDLWWKNARFAAWHLWKNGRESMGSSILNVVLSSLAIIEQKLPNDGLSTDVVHDMVRAVRHFAHQRQTVGAQKISSSFVSFLEENFSQVQKIAFLTLSSSSTITSCIMQALEQTRPQLDIRVLESRPLFEGIKVADAIVSFANESGVETSVSVFTDASAGIAAQGVDVVIIGADLLDGDGNVCNKTGSLPAVLSARHISPNARVIVLSEKEKILPFEHPEQEENDPQEVFDAWERFAPSLKTKSAAQVNVRNVYFEWVTSDLIDDYVTEDGVVSAEGIAECAQDVSRKADRFFGAL